ncbi:MAG: hypothetical protein ACK43K_14725, partial [Chitinophagales bacterium]
LVFGFIFLEKRYKFLPIGLVPALILLIASIFIAGLSAQLAELDSRKYMKDAILLISFLDKDSSLYGLFFLTGGNGLYPQYYFPMLIASNTWSNYTSFTIEKFFLFFSLISKPNLFNVSLFFGVLSFVSKSLLLKSLHNIDPDARKVKILYAFLLIGGIDIFFVSGVYKENLLLLFLCVVLYVVYSSPKWWKYLLALLCLTNAIFIRLDTVILLLIVLLVVVLYSRLEVSKWQNKILLFLFPLIPLILLFNSPYRVYVLDKLNRYGRLKAGNTHFDFIDWKADAIDLIGQILRRWLEAFYSIHTATFYLVILNFVCALTLAFIIYLFYHQSRVWNRITVYFTMVFFSFMLVVSLLVHNYAAILRYRSPLLIFMVFGLILNLRKK